MLFCVWRSCLSCGHVRAILVDSYVKSKLQKASQLAAQIGPQTGTSSIAAACFATCPRWRCPLSKIATCQGVLNVSLESEGQATKRCATQRAKPSLEEEDELACNSPVCLAFTTDLVQTIQFLPGPTVNLRNAHLKHLTRTAAHCTLPEDGHRRG